MSRSYKKTIEVCKDNGGSYKKLAKKLANKRVRKTLDVPDGKCYRKVYSSWNLCDWRFWWSISDELQSEQTYYREIKEKKKEGRKIYSRENKILDKGFPTYEMVYKKRRRFGR